MAANQERGELGLEAGGVSYVLRLTINGICELETLTGRPWGSILVGIAEGRMRDTRLLLWAALQARHADTIKTVDDVGALLDQVGSTKTLTAKATALVDQLIALNEPPPELQKASGEADPRTAQAGTGSDSTSTPGASG